MTKLRTAERPATLVNGKWFLGEGDQISSVLRVREDGVIVFKRFAGFVQAVRYRGKSDSSSRFKKMVYVRPTRVEPAIPIEDDFFIDITVRSAQ
jgi:hypothetical protein